MDGKLFLPHLKEMRRLLMHRQHNKNILTMLMIGNVKKTARQKNFKIFFVEALSWLTTYPFHNIT